MTNMILRLYRILEGFLRVCFQGENKEKIISLCASNGITLWNTRLKGEEIESSISVRDFRLLKNLKPKGVRVHILKKRGIPFIVNRYKHRYGIAVGVLTFFLIIQMLSSYIWIIDIKGNHKVSEEKIVNALGNIGITEGINKNKIYPKAEREKLLLELEDIAWAAINIEGSRLTVNVTEVKDKPKEKSYTNLKSGFDGTIERLDIVSGTSLVKVGQAVKKGDLLVSGIIESEDGTRFVNSKGTVTAKIEREIKLTENYIQQKLIPTGEIRRKYVVKLLGFKIPLYLGKEMGEFNAVKSEKSLKIFGNKLPIKLYKKKFSFHKKQNVNYSYENLCNRLEKSFNQEVKELESFKIIEKEFVRNGEGVTLSAVLEIRQNIEYEDILLINTGN